MELHERGDDFDEHGNGSGHRQLEREIKRLRHDVAALRQARSGGGGGGEQRAEG